VAPSICFKYPTNSKISLNNYKNSTNFPIKKII